MGHHNRQKKRWFEAVILICQVTPDEYALSIQHGHRELSPLEGFTKAVAVRVAEQRELSRTVFA